MALILVGCQVQQNSTAETIVIADDLPSPTDALTRPGDQAITFAVQRVGRVAGFNLVLRRFDNSLGGTQSAFRGRENIDRAIEDPAVLGVVGPWTSPLAYAQLPAANQASLVMVSPSATGNCLTVFAPTCPVTASELRPTGNVTFFRLAPPDIEQGQAMAAYAATSGFHSVAIFNEFGSAGLPYVDGFRQVFEKSGRKVVLVEDLPDGTASFSSYLNDASRRGADAVYAVANASDGACKAALQMKTLLPGASFLANDGITFDPQCIKDAGADAAEGIVATFADVDPRQSTVLEANSQVRAYLKAYPKSSDVDEYTFAAYDATMLLIDALRRAISLDGGKRPSRQQVVDAVAATQDFVGVTGTYSFDANGDAKSPLMSIYRVEGGNWVRIGP